MLNFISLHFRNYIKASYLVAFILLICFSFTTLVYSSPNRALLSVQLQSNDGRLINGSKTVSILVFDTVPDNVIWAQTFSNVSIEEGFIQLPLGPFPNDYSLDINHPHIRLQIDSEEIILDDPIRLMALYSNYAKKAKSFVDSDAISSHLQDDGRYYLGLFNSNPTEKLELNGNLKLSGSNSQLIFSNTSNSNSSSNIQTQLQFNLSSSGPQLYYNSGNFGLGTLFPLHTLDVNGTFRFNGIQDTTSNSRALFINDENILKTNLILDASFDGYEDKQLAIGTNNLLLSLNSDPILSVHPISNKDYLFLAISTSNSYGLRFPSSNTMLSISTSDPSALFDIDQLSSSIPLFLFENVTRSGFFKLDEYYRASLSPQTNTNTLFSIQDPTGTNPILLIKDKEDTSIVTIEGRQTTLNTTVDSNSQLHISTTNISLLNTNGGYSSIPALVYNSSTNQLSQRTIDESVWRWNLFWAEHPSSTPSSPKLYMNPSISQNVVIGSGIDLGKNVDLMVAGPVKTSHFFKFPNNTTQLTAAIYDGNYWGIGLPNPSAKLHIQPSTSSPPLFKVFTNEKPGHIISQEGTLTVGSHVTSDITVSIVSTSNVDSAFHIGRSTTTYFDISPYGTVGIGMNGTNNEKLSVRLSANEKVEINAASSNIYFTNALAGGLYSIQSTQLLPSNLNHSFHILNPDSNVLIDLATSSVSFVGTPNILVGSSDTGHIGFNYPSNFYTTANIYLKKQSTQSHPIFKISNSSSQEIMIVSTNAHLGIGTGNPSSLLTIEGDQLQTQAIFSALSDTGDGIIVTNNGELIITTFNTNTPLQISQINT